ncbi:hypothetical protein P2G88_12640 [Aliiglaciecola sp. CAU 1673]|uniref:hypothetical protein n=1 Tax=Aliiglaciecola sp. CAU 1673 TaxID=3032595 RepID=UPI0023DC8A65|nr:hypothetical protein [Aliiglaciecola sp. CAU 1673]MDF2179100.1 hypothetical protein [Aliiglaciecola sp. CAU 1673]
MIKLFNMSAADAAIYLSRNLGPKKSWLYALQENRLGRGFFDVGRIPFKVVKNKVFYDLSDMKLLVAALLAATKAKSRPARVF